MSLFNYFKKRKEVGLFRTKAKTDSPQGLAKGVFQKDLYFFLMEASWTKLFFFVFIIYLISNIFFALLYSLDPSGLSHPGESNFLNYFFFSVQTMSTIGYGSLSPQSIYTNWIVTIEAAFGLIGVAIITGVIFSKLSRPYAKILFSNKMIFSLFDGQKCLAFRLGNTRGNEIVEAKVTVSALIDYKTKEGKDFRQILNLPLKRNYSPFFTLTWTVFHPVDETSPLKDIGVDSKKLKGLVVTVSGHDGTYSNTVYARYVYYPDDIVFDKYFMDIMEESSQGVMEIDYQNFHTIV